MAKVQFQVDGLDSNTASIFNDDVTFDGNVDAASISIGGTDILQVIPPGPAYSDSAPSNPTVGQVWIDSDSSVTEYDLSAYATLADPSFTGAVVLPSTTSIGNVSATEIGYLDGVTSSIQTQLNAKAAATDFSNTAWTSFTPALKTNGGTITLGDGTMEASYKQIGKTVHVRYKFTIGSTTSIGINEIVFGLPVTASSPDYNFAGAALDGGNAWYSLTGVGRYLGLTTEFAMISYSGTGKVFVGVSSSSIFPLLDGDYITISGSYEAA